MADFNPYAAPEAEIAQAQLRASEIEPGRGVWADGKVLVMAKAAHLPHRCIRCNEPASSWVTRKFMWHPWGWYLLALIWIWPYVIAALIVRDTAKLAIPFCPAHRAARTKAFRINWAVGLLGLAFCFAPAIDPNLVALTALGVLMIIGSLVFAATKSSILTPKRIDKTHAWYLKAGPAFLASLPPLPDAVVEI